MRRPALLILGLASLALAADDGGPVPPRSASWPEVAVGLFDVRWATPDVRVPEPERPRRVDLRTEMIRVAALTFPPVEGERELEWAGSFGDIARAFLACRDDDDDVRQRLAELREARPSVWREIGPYLPELVRDARVLGDDWDPDDDEDDDGLLLVEPFDRSQTGSEFWVAAGGTKDVHQGAALILADLEALKTAENDYATYDDNVDADYEAIHAVRDGYVRGIDDAGKPFAVTRLWFRTDLPFPYGDFTADIRIWTHLDVQGRLLTDIYSTSEDVYWLGGQDTAIPVRASDGSWVATLLVRVYGFDIRSVPDGDGARKGALRASLGNLKRNAERHFRDAGGNPRTVEGAIPEFVVTGAGPVPDDHE